MRWELGPTIWVEEVDDSNDVIVSWTSGHKRVRRDDMLDMLASAVEDTYHRQWPVRYPERRLKS